MKGALGVVSKEKRSKYEATEECVDAVMGLIFTLRRLNLIPVPKGQYESLARVFNVWNFAKKYGVSKNGR